MSSLLAQPGVKWVVGGWAMFITENLVLSENRSQLVALLDGDEAKYRACYGALSTFACGSIFYGLVRHRNSGPKLFVGGPGPVRVLGALALQGVGLGMLSQLAPPVRNPFVSDTGTTAGGGSSSGANTSGGFRCPMDFQAAKAESQHAVYGVKRVSRHPQLWGLGIAALGTALVSPCAVEAFFFLGFPCFAVLGTEHQDSRFRRNIGGTLDPEIDRVTSNVPFLALAQGKQQWQDLVNEGKRNNAACAGALALLLALIRRVR